jgi:hypothetical protein
MKLDSLSEHSSGLLALLCAVTVFVAVALDAQGDVVPVAATAVGAAP